MPWMVSKIYEWFRSKRQEVFWAAAVNEFRLFESVVAEKFYSIGIRIRIKVAFNRRTED